MADRKVRESELSPREAVTHFERALKDAPNDPVAHLNLASAHYAAGNLDAAFQELREAVALSPSLDHAHYYLGVIYAKRGDPANARQEFEKVLTGSGHMLLKSQAKIQLQALNGK